MTNKKITTEQPLNCHKCGMDAKYSSFGTHVGYRCGSLFDVSLIIQTSPACVVIAELKLELSILKGERIIGMEHLHTSSEQPKEPK